MKFESIELPGGMVGLVGASFLGTLNGYVGIPENHPWFGRDYQTFSRVPVHGGLTFSGRHESHPDLWFFGFDTAHADDYAPAIGSFLGTEPMQLKGRGYVVREILKLGQYLSGKGSN
jgi:hypothetical protein